LEDAILGHFIVHCSALSTAFFKTVTTKHISIFMTTKFVAIL